MLCSALGVLADDSTLSWWGAPAAGTGGPTLPGTEVKIHHVPGRDKEGEGEVCMRGRHVMMGYMFSPEKTQESIQSDGFLHSGDIGSIDKFGM